MNALLCDIYGKQKQQARRLRRCRHHRGQDKKSAKEKRLCRRSSNKGPLSRMASTLAGNETALQTLSVRQLIDVSAMLKVEILMMGYLLERVLITRDRQRRHQEVLCEFVTAVLIVETSKSNVVSSSFSQCSQLCGRVCCAHDTQLADWLGGFLWAPPGSTRQSSAELSAVCVVSAENRKRS